MLHCPVKLCQSDTYSCGTAFCNEFFLLYDYFKRRISRILSVKKFCEMLREFFHSSIMHNFILLVIISFPQNFRRLKTFLLK